MELLGLQFFIPACKHSNLFGGRNSDTLIFYQQQQAESSPNAHQQAGPEYEEVIELSENMAYAPVQRIKMKANEAYQFVGQY